jgi:hypothetical protein
LAAQHNKNRAGLNLAGPATKFSRLHDQNLRRKIMFNKSFFLGILTAILALGILAAGLTVAAQGFSGAGPGGRGDRPGGFETDRSGMEFGDLDRENGGSFEREGHGGHMSFSPLRGLGGIAGNLLVVAVIIGAVVLGQQLYSRYGKKRAGPADTAAASPEPDSPPEASVEPDPVGGADESEAAVDTDQPNAEGSAANAAEPATDADQPDDEDADENRSPQT